MKAKYYVLSPNGEKIGPADIVRLTEWAREGKILPENTICDESGETCNARDIISFMKVAPKKKRNPGEYQMKGAVALLIVLTVLMSVSAVAYVGLRANYEQLKRENAKLVSKYETIEKALKDMEEENIAIQKNAEEIIGKMVKKYNMLESEKDQLNDQLNSAREQSRSFEELKEIVGREAAQRIQNTENAETGLSIPMPENLKKSQGGVKTIRE